MTNRPIGESRAAAVLPHGRRNFLAKRLYAENRRAIMRVIVDAAINVHRIPRLEDLAVRTGMCVSAAHRHLWRLHADGCITLRREPGVFIARLPSGRETAPAGAASL